MDETAQSARAELAAIQQVVALAGRRVLDVGCGDGRLTLGLQAAGATVVGLDIDASELWQARRRDAQIVWVEGRAERLPVAKASVDVVLWSWSLWNVVRGGQGAALREGQRVVRPDGLLVEVRPLPGDPQVEIVRPDGRRVGCGALRPSDATVLARQTHAEQVILQALARGAVRLAGQVEFDWVNGYGDADELVETVLETWTARTIDEATALRLAQAMADAPSGSRAVIRQAVMVRGFTIGAG